LFIIILFRFELFLNLSTRTAKIVGYELNTLLHVVNSFYDDISFVNFFKDAAAIYDHK
ncbi:hypothetical protein S245_048697, partial [Arachis hypogaea]